MKIKEIKLGDVILLDDGFTCAEAGLVTIQENWAGYFFSCEQGQHYLDGQEDAAGDLIGMSRPPGEFILNGKRRRAGTKNLAYETIIQMAGFRPGTTMTVTYRVRLISKAKVTDRVRSDAHEDGWTHGILIPGETILNCEQAIINCGDTSNS